MQTIHRSFSLQVSIRPDALAAGDVLAEAVKTLVQNKPDAAIGLTASSELTPFYKRLIRMHQKDGLDFSRIRFFHLDGEIDTTPSVPESVTRCMWDSLYKYINVTPENIFIPECPVEELAREQVEVAHRIAGAGGLDMLIVDLASVDRLSVDSLCSADDRSKPKHDDGVYLAAGMKTVLNARQCIVMGTGRTMASLAADAAEGPVGSGPASLVFKQHKNAWIVLDEAAAEQLKLAEYYQWIESNRPLPKTEPQVDKQECQAAREQWLAADCSAR